MSARSKALAPVGAVVAVVAIAGAAALLSQDGGSGRPARLHLAAGAREASGLSAPAATADAKIAGGGAYTLTGSLPSGTPDDGRAYALPRGFADESVVRKLATALDVPAPVKGKGGWTAGGLTVSASSGQAWWWSPCFTPDGTVSNAKDAVCAVAIEGSGSSSSGSGSAPAAGAPDAPVAVAPPGTVTADPRQPTCPSPPPGMHNIDCGVQPLPPLPPLPPTPIAVPSPPATPTGAAVRAATASVLEALGIDDSAAHVQTYPGGGSVTVDPKVDGLDTVGLSTSIGVDSQGAITNASGWLSVPNAGDRYPLISAQKAFEALPTYGRMEMLCPVGPDGKGCTAPEPQVVTGAHLGLSVANLQSDELALLPTWLFDVRGQDLPLPGIAVDPSYLDTGTPTATDDPGVVPPGEPSSTDPVPSTPVAITGWSPSTADNAVTVHYTTDGCGLTDVAADVKEDTRTVYVVLHGTPPGPQVACSEIAQQQTYEVALQDPLGTRAVVDANSGQPVPRA